MKRLLCFFDGACSGNQFATKGPMWAAYVAEDTECARQIPDLPTPDGPIRSNNIAEYQALILLLEYLGEFEMKFQQRGSYLICGDSQLVIRQMQGQYKVREAHLVPLHSKATRLSGRLDVEFKWAPRHVNRAGALLETRRR